MLISKRTKRGLQLKSRKIMIVDTSVLLYDKHSIHSFPGNDVFLPMVVLDEIDKFKEKPGLLGEAARYINRFLDKVRESGRLDQGVYIEEEDQNIAVLTEDYDSIPGLDGDRNDNKIIAAAVAAKNKFSDQKILVITKDINLRVKCDALGIPAEDYYKDSLDLLEFFTGICETNVTDLEIDSIYSTGSIPVEKNLPENLYSITKGEQQGKSALCFHNNGRLNLLPNDLSCTQTDIKPRNKEQSFALHALLSSDIPLVTLTGLAGSGKTFLSLMVALDAVLNKKYERIIVTRSVETVGKDIGYLPGDLKEKMEPWMAPMMDTFRHHFKDKTYFEMMMDKGTIEIAPLSFIRGRTFNNSFVIVDEAQNTTIHELKTIITRVGEGSKIVLMGDTDQIDTPYIDKKSNGLSIVIEKMKMSKLSAHVHLERGERSELATLASQVL